MREDEGPGTPGSYLYRKGERKEPGVYKYAPSEPSSAARDTVAAIKLCHLKPYPITVRPPSHSGSCAGYISTGGAGHGEGQVVRYELFINLR